MADAAMERVAMAGYGLPDQVVIAPERFAPGRVGRDGTKIAGEFVSQGRGFSEPPLTTVYLNPQYPWGTVSARGSTRDPLHPILHELGHAAHYHEDPDRFVASTLQPPPSEVARRVSAYADGARSAKEFVAEVFVMRILGLPVDLDVARYYDSFSGPSPTTVDPASAEGRQRLPEAWPADAYY